RAVPPFSGGSIDIVAPDGTVVCSSRDLPPSGWYADQPWLASDAGATTSVTTLRDADDPVLVVTAPIDQLGVVAAVMSTAGIDEALATRFGGDEEQFAVRAEDGTPITEPLPDDGVLRGASDVDGLGWLVEAGIDESAATASARTALNQSRLVALIGSLVLLLAVIGVNRLLVRPVRRLDAEVARAMAGDAPRPVGGSGPSEVVALADNFSTLARNVTSELDRRQQAEDDARRSATALRQLFDANPLPMWVHDRDTGEILMSNAALVTMLGTEQIHAPGATATTLLPADAPAWLQVPEAGEGRAVVREGPWSFDGPDGDPVECEVTSDVIDFDGRRGRLVIVEDVTAARRTQRMIAEMQRMDSLGQLAGGIAHDFNNLLTVILNYVALVRDGLAERERAPDNDTIGEVRTDLEHVLVAAERAAALTGQLLAFAKGEAIQMRPVDVNEVVTQVDGLLGRTLGEHIRITTELGRDLPAALADPAQLEQILVNLAVNARDAMPSGGALTIETGAVVLADDERPDVGPGTYVRIRVSDSGHGMDAATRRRAFEPFFTTKPRGSGTGLGLSTVYGIVTRSGGAVELYSEPDHGTTVGVLLPSVDHAVPAPVAPAGSRAVRDGGRVLVVEDDESLRLVAERILTNGGYDVEVATDGAAALARLAIPGLAIDLVLSDAVMPGLLGVELVAEIRRSHPSVRVALMSGHL
ncbi:MAG: ATP-binding protein, partial [Acidimicrobiia bacterium]